MCFGVLLKSSVFIFLNVNLILHIIIFMCTSLVRQITSSSYIMVLPCNIWKLVNGICSTDENMRKNGFENVFICCLCRDADESVEFGTG